MEQTNIGHLVHWVEECKCQLCPEKATWLNTSGGYCDKCFPNYSELGIERLEFLKNKAKKNEKRKNGNRN